MINVTILNPGDPGYDPLHIYTETEALVLDREQADAWARTFWENGRLEGATEYRVRVIQVLQNARNEYQRQFPDPKTRPKEVVDGIRLLTGLIEIV